jgi:hypothetical protein
MESNKNSVLRWIYFIPLTLASIFILEFILRFALRFIVILYLLVIEDLRMKEVFEKMKIIIPSAQYKTITGFILAPIIILAYYFIGSNVGPENSKIKQKTLLVLGLLGYSTSLILDVVMSDTTHTMLSAWLIFWLLIFRKITTYEEV